MWDLTEDIIKSQEKQKSWTNINIEKYVYSWKKLDDSLLFEIDFESDEQWIRILKDDSMIGMLSVKIPLLFLHNFYEVQSINTCHTNEPHIVRVISFKEKLWCIDLDILKEFVPVMNWHAHIDAVNPKAMSINDLWYATV